MVLTGLLAKRMQRDKLIITCSRLLLAELEKKKFTPGHPDSANLRQLNV